MSKFKENDIIVFESNGKRYVFRISQEPESNKRYSCESLGGSKQEVAEKYRVSIDNEDDFIQIRPGIWKAKRAQDNAAINSVANFNFPNVKRPFPQTIANDIVSVQPMSLPAGLIFYMDFKYGKENGDA